MNFSKETTGMKEKKSKMEANDVGVLCPKRLSPSFLFRLLPRGFGLKILTTRIVNSSLLKSFY